MAVLDIDESSQQNAVNYAPPGPVAAEFHKAKAFVRGLMGPVGSGKSSSCCVEIVRHSLLQTPFRGVRRARWAVIRNTFPELKSTTIKTWQQWFPDSIAPIKWDSPISSRMLISDIGDGTSLDLEVLFLALDSPQDTGKLRSLELTGGWINEASEVPKEVFDMLTQRVGRYPPKMQAGPVDACVILDTNPPDDDSWYYKFAEEETPEGWLFFRQPGALQIVNDVYEPNPDAENVGNIPNGYGYYFNQLGGKTEDWINVFLLGQYGTTMSGKPVYGEYRESTHTSKEPIKTIPGAPIYLGWDFGLTPACVIAQITAKGRINILRELIAGIDDVREMGIRQFAAEVVKPVLANDFPRHKIISACDPAGNTRSQADEKTCIQELQEAGIYTEVAASNDFIQRREAVAYFLTRMADGEAGFLIDPSCRYLRKGFNGGYRYERVKTNAEMYRDRPVKDKFSHPHDALQYLCMRVRSEMNPIVARTVVAKKAVGWT